MNLNELRQQALLDPDLPAGLRRALEAGANLESIHLDARGRWWHQGEPFINQRLIGLFHRSLHHTPSGTWLLTIPPFSYPVTVEGVGRFAHRIERRDGTTILHLRDGREVPFHPHALTTNGEDGLYTIIDGDVARFVDDAWKTLSPHIDLVDHQWQLNWHGTSYPIAADTSAVNR